MKIWSSAAPDGGRYVALFNTGAKARTVELELGKIGIPTVSGVRDLWARKAVAISGRRLVRQLPPHGADLLKVR